jgi:hypothetical protein
LTRRYYAVLARISPSYPPLQGRLVTCYSPVRHCTQVLLPFLVRLACVRHAASVDSEPGSNSRLKPSLSCHPDGGRFGSTTPAQSLQRAYYLPCEKIKPKPDRFSRLARSTLLSKILESGPPERCPFWIEARAVTPRCPRTYCALPDFRLLAVTGIFARTF